MRVYQATGQLDAAFQRYEEALRIKRVALGPDHPSVALTLLNVGLLRKDQGAADDARRLVSEALQIFTARLGAEHPNTQRAGRALAALQA